MNLKCFILILLCAAGVLFAETNGITLDVSTSTSDFTVLYFSENGQITKIPEYLFEGMYSKETSAKISHNGNQLTYSYYNDEAQAYDICSVYLNSGNVYSLSELLNHFDYGFHLIDLSPDGDVALYTRYNGDYTALCITDFDKNNAEIAELSRSRSYFSYARWLSNMEIVYNVKKDDVNELYLLNMHDMNSRLINDSLGGFGDISNDGKLIFNKENGISKDGFIDVYTGDITYFDTNTSDFVDYKWSSGSTKVVFIRTADNNEELYLMDIHSFRMTKLMEFNDVDGFNYNYCIGWFDNDTKFIFSSGMNDSWEGIIYTIDMNTFETVNLSEQEDAYYIFGKACPFLSIFDGDEYDRYIEILTSHNNEANERTEQIILPGSYLADNRIIIKIEEILDEITYLDRVQIKINDKIYMPVNAQAELLEVDNDYLELQQDEAVNLEFIINEETGSDIILECTGYYFPFY